jgi:hypothetical protein
MKGIKTIIVALLIAFLAVPLIIGGLMAALTVVGTIWAWAANPTVMLVLLLIGFVIVLPIVLICNMVK